MENEIITSWEKNAEEWVRVIDAGKIESRKFTNNAIVQFLEKTPGNKILDVGCGEGWLTRRIIAMGRNAVGIDATEKLLENAKSKGPERYFRMQYDDIIAGIPIPEAPFDMAVFNFCLYQKEGSAELLEHTKKSLFDDSSIVIQTLHPYFLIKSGLAYRSQTIHDSWKGLPGNFIEGHSWYARTFEDWMAVFSSANLQMVSLEEVLNKENEPISLIIQLK